MFQRRPLGYFLKIFKCKRVKLGDSSCLGGCQAGRAMRQAFVSQSHSERSAWLHKATDVQAYCAGIFGRCLKIEAVKERPDRGRALKTPALRDLNQFKSPR